MTLEEKKNNYYEKALDFCIKNNYQLVTKKDEMVRYDIDAQYICPQHGLKNVKLYSLLRGYKCYECGRYRSNENQIMWSNIWYKRVIDKCSEYGYILITQPEEIKNQNSYIKYECPKHGIKSMKIGNLISGRKCKECGRDDVVNKLALPLIEAKTRVESRGGKILNINDYKTMCKKNLLISCPECGEPILTSVKLFTQREGQLCKNCTNSESIGEKKIRHFLEDHNIKFIKQKWFSDCRDVNPLPFDFYLPLKNTIIEFDGRQHFEDTEFFSYDYETTHKHDLIKNKYCKNNNINLIRISYIDINKIDKILTKYLIDSHKDIV